MLHHPQEHKTYWSFDVQATLDALDTDSTTGLSSEDAENRLKIFGKNTLKSSKSSGKFRMFLDQLSSPLIIVLIIAGVVMLFLEHIRDAIFIFIAVVVNSVLGFWQENKAEQALAKLKTYIKQRAKIIRDNKEHEIDVEEIVPGDIVRLSQGDRVPADARIIFSNDLQIDESILTGESLPVSKNASPAEASAAIADQSSMVFAGTLVTQGIGTIAICQTSAKTELGKIASLIESSEDEKTPLQRAIARFSLYLSGILILLTIAVFGIGIHTGKPILEMFLTSVAIAVSAIPEGLPISMTVILAIGVERMAKRKGVVRKLVAAEALGSTTLILTDKTGTLTMAEMRMSQIVPVAADENSIICGAILNTDVLVENPEDDPETWRINGRIMETAIVRGATRRGYDRQSIFDRSEVLHMLPFNSTRKFSAVCVADGKDRITIIALGAPDVLIAHSSLDKERKEKLLARIAEVALTGERVLGLARITIDQKDTLLKIEDPSTYKNMNFDGLLTFKDPIRPGIKHSIERIRRAGVKTVIITGDHHGTAIAIAREIGIASDETSMLSAVELASMSDDELKSRLPHIHVISRVTPADKLRIVKLYQELGETVAMTGDGINDAPSIKQADVGIAMGSGTEVSRSVADLVLLDDNFETIVAAIEEGRQIISNIRKVLVYLLSNVTDGLILIGGSILAGIPLPLNALQILWVNFFSDSFPAIAFAFEKDPDVLSHRPPGKKLTLFDPFIKFLILVIGISTSTLLFALYFMLIHLGYDQELVRTFIFAAFGTYTLLLAFSVRSLNKSIISYGFLSNGYLLSGISIGIILMAAAIYIPLFQKLFGTVPLPLQWVAGVILVGIFNILLIEFAKLAFHKQRKLLSSRA